MDTLGLPHAIAITCANVGDREGGLFSSGVQEILHEGVEVQIAKRNEQHTFEVLPRRWVVARSFAWLEQNRRLWKNCERLLNTSLQFPHRFHRSHSQKIMNRL